MRRTLETLFRYPLRWLAFLLLLPALGFAAAYFLPGTYDANASLWALRRYEVIGSTGPESNLTATPADTQATALSELLSSRSFAISIAKATQLPSTLSASDRANPQSLDEALYSEVSKNVKVASKGYNLYTVAYTNKNAQVARQVVQQTIAKFSTESQNFSVVEAQHILDGYTTQESDAKKVLSQAVQNEGKYVSAHPTASVQDRENDPQYASLHAQTQTDQSNLQAIQSKMADLRQQISSHGANSQVQNSMFNTLDDTSTTPTSRLKTLLIGAGVGLGIGVLSMVLLMVALIRRDRAIYNASDVHKVSMFPVVIQASRLAR